MRSLISLRAFGTGCLAIAGVCTGASATRFYPDDPLWKEPPPRNLTKPEKQSLNPLVDFYKNTLKKKGERQTPGHVIPSEGMNTLGEVYDSSWFTNRHDLRHRMSEADLVKGPDTMGPPDGSKNWNLTGVKAEGVTPGFSIKDSRGRKYLIKFDPLTNPELATAADVICAKFFYAIGYNVPENYIVTFTPEQINIPEALKFTDHYGQEKTLTRRDFEELLDAVPRDSSGKIRALASFFIPGESVGSFKYYKRRNEDPNETSSHEHMRVLRGLHTFSAWLNHTDNKALNTLETVVSENGTRFIRHYLIDFGSALGSDALRAKDPRFGYDYMAAPKPAMRDLFTLGVYVPKYLRVDYPNDPAVGNIEVEAFEPDKWRTNYPNPAFENRLPGDEFWAARKIMAFTDSDIEAIVKTGQFSSPSTVAMLTKVLRERRDKVGRTFFGMVLPLDDLRIDSDQLKYTDLAVQFGLRPAADTLQVRWSRFDNASGKIGEPSGDGVAIPAAMKSAPAGSYWAAAIHSEERKKSLTAYFRRDGDWKLVGIEREGENQWKPR